MNNWTFYGNLGADAQVKHLQNGQQLLIFDVAIDRSYQQQGQWIDRVEWVRVLRSYPVNTEIKVLDRLKKGSTVLVEGFPNANAWKDQQGEARSVLQCNAATFRVLK